MIFTKLDQLLQEANPLVAGDMDPAANLPSNPITNVQSYNQAAPNDLSQMNSNVPVDGNLDQPPTDENEIVGIEEPEDEEIEDEEEEAPKESKVLDKFIEAFNKEKDKYTNVKIEKYEPNSNFKKSFKIVLKIDNDELYLDKKMYADGKIEIGLNDLFYKDLLKVASRFGIDDIEWKNDDDVEYGTIELVKD